MANLYHQVASEIIAQIENGVYRVGEKLPGVRAISLQRGVSPATVVAAYDQLLNGGYVESRPRSGFYVRIRAPADFLTPKMSQLSMSPREVVGQQLVLQLLQQTQQSSATRLASVINLGAAVADVSVLPTIAVEKSIIKMTRLQRSQLCCYEFPPGNYELRLQIAKRMAQLGCQLSPDDIVITNGCQEALLLALKAITQPGDAVAIESPTYYGLLQIIEHLGLKAIEIPTDPQAGISLDALQLAIEHWSIKACLVVTNFSNPLGATLSDSHKKALAHLCRKTKVALIEDDIYGDLGFSAQRPSVCKRFDEKVIYCSSFSKSLAPGLRVGWVAAKALAPAISQLKFMSNSALPTIVQMAVADLLASGKYDRHLRAMRIKLTKSMHEMIIAIERYFPPGTRITQPLGGFVLWVELPLDYAKANGSTKAKKIDTFDIALQALEENIAIAPGKLFSAAQKYQHCLRLSSGGDWTPTKEKALKRLGELIKSFLGH
ncbi:MAG: PLP-dependent aminotransferase family protein [Pseudomonadota bacterium]